MVSLYNVVVKWPLRFGRPSIPDTLSPERTVLIIEVSLFEGLKVYVLLVFSGVCP